MLIPYGSRTYAKNWSRVDEGIVVKLSNGIIQFFWNTESVTLRSYKWVKWRINQEEGEANINQKNFPEFVKVKVDCVREFLLKNSINSKMKSQKK